MSCCFFGHKDAPSEIQESLTEEIRQLIVHHNVSTFYVGNQGNFDSMALRALRKLSEEYSVLYRVILAYLPENDTSLQSVLSSETVYPEGIEKVPKQYAISWRNDWMLRRSQFIIAYVLHDFGGASTFVRKATRQGKKIINLAHEGKEAAASQMP